jgi:hypothetical protein
MFFTVVRNFGHDTTRSPFPWLIKGPTLAGSETAGSWFVMLARDGFFAIRPFIRFSLRGK